MTQGKRFLALALVFTLIFAILPLEGAAEESPPVPEIAFRSNQVLVRFQPWVSENEKARVSRAQGGRIAGELEEADFGLISLGVQTDPLATALRLNQDARVEWAEPNYLRKALFVPNDPYYTSQWALPRIEAEPGWDFSGSEIVIAIVDTGVDLDHPDLASRLVPGYNFVDNNDQPMDDNGHGTHVAGIAAAAGNNGLGVTGVSWSAKIMPIKALDAKGMGNDYQAAQGIIWAADHGARVINLSFGGTQYSSTLQEAINYAYGKGAIIVGATGNEAEKGNPIFYPAALDHVMAVGALDSNDTRALFSGFGGYVDISAPGVSILSTALDNSYAAMSGTSMAAPFVSGQAGLLLSRKPDQTAEQVEETIRQTAYDLGESGRDDQYGYGRISIARALSTIPVAAPQGAAEGSIQGQIITTEGKLAADARVETGQGSALADATGSFTLSGLSSGVYNLLYSAPGYAGQKQEAIPVTSGTTRVPTVVLSPAQGEIRGKVTNSRGRGIGGAVVRIDQTVVPTDTKGRFCFIHLSDGLYTIYYDAAGFKGQRQENISVAGGITVVPTVVLSR